MPINSILNVFAKSPIEPLQEHINTVHECACFLTPFFNAVISNDWNYASKVREQIHLTEKKADRLKRRIRLTLPSGLFLPVERSDLLELLIQQDRIANTAKDIAGRVLGRQLVFPSSIHSPFLSYLDRSLDAVTMAKEAINELEDLLETGFTGREVNLVEKMIRKIDGIEEDTDTLQVTICKQLFDIEETLNPIDAMLLYKIIEWVGDLADFAENVGARLELMLARV
ncbi:TIGR00153 family protein [uncultured Shewanella sp.]|uniref:TIGR00153 family protein n=1 Tax=uncultured Shewanella sp. TaxID=173975 RepID=UPI0026080FEE|nr:TIGR00153 family protein [uncultured Shewanella sp.]